ncbi:methyl-accepting chemotaxis protein, partial [Enterobacter cloacae complex sp. 4DZ3-17B2]|uniref:methyl-accepting chemotaxis protein n=1 Tax=Enterobacter cloacae complex sp. 4DZ3-17B2 TaxID=2511990 RepID=UPI0021074687
MEQISAGTKQSSDSSRELHKITTSSYDRASHMEQISAGTKQSSDSSRERHQITTSSYDSASHGEVMMEVLKSKMDLINSCSVDMSEVIVLIDSISFQTNILFINASVEAVRVVSAG